MECDGSPEHQTALCQARQDANKAEVKSPAFAHVQEERQQASGRGMRIAQEPREQGRLPVQVLAGQQQSL